MLIAIAILDEKLKAAGIPFDGISGGPGSVRVDYQPEATPAQRTQGAAIIAAFDWTLAAERAAETAATGNDLTLRQQAESALVDLRAFRDRTSTTLSTAQNIAILKLLCRVAIGLIRLVLKRLDGAN